MKITQKELKKLIKEEIQSLSEEQNEEQRVQEVLKHLNAIVAVGKGVGYDEYMGDVSSERFLSLLRDAIGKDYVGAYVRDVESFLKMIMSAINQGASDA